MDKIVKIAAFFILIISLSSCSRSESEGFEEAELKLKLKDKRERVITEAQEDRNISMDRGSEDLDNYGDNDDLVTDDDDDDDVEDGKSETDR